MTDFSLVFEDPPERTRGGTGEETPWFKRLLPLIDKPGAWARVAVGPKRSSVASLTTYLKTQANRPPGRWEFAYRSMDSEVAAVYARYLGPEEEEGA